MTYVERMLASERAIGCPRYGRAQADRPLQRFRPAKRYQADWLAAECERVETLTRFALAGLDVRESRLA